MSVSAARTFLAVVACGNLNKAADVLSVSPSTVTSRIDALEQQTGQKLLLRSKAGTQLTGAGFRFQRYAEMLVQTWDLAMRDAGLPAGFSSVCNVGCQLDLWTGLAGPWINRIRREHPDVALSMWSGDATAIARWVSGGMVDLAVSLEPVTASGWESRVIAQDRLVQIATVERSIQRWDPDYVYVDHGPEFRRQHAAAYPVDETPSMTFGSAGWALEFILTNGGSGYIPYRMAADHIESGALFTVKGTAEFVRPVYLAHNGDVTRDWSWFDVAVNSLGTD